MDLFIIFAACVMTAAVASVLFSPSFRVAGDGLQDGSSGKSVPVRTTDF
jgi:hypothetical protein